MPAPTTTTRRDAAARGGVQSHSSGSATRGLLSQPIGERWAVVRSQQVLHETQ